MATPEGIVKDWFAREIKKLYPTAKRIRWPAGQYGKAGISDDILCIAGHFIAVEAKSDSTKNPTSRQANFLLEVTKAGGLGLVLRGKDSTIFDHIESWVLYNKRLTEEPKTIQDFMV